MALAAVIFDLDGVLVDTVSLHFKAWQKLFSEYGKTFSFQDYKSKVDGIPSIDGAKAILAEFSQRDLYDIVVRKKEYFFEFAKEEGIKPYATSVSFVEELKAHHIKVAVISSSKSCREILQLAGISDSFEVVVTTNDIDKGKPEPEIFLKAAQELDVPPKNCVVFEDALLGVEAAKRAGMKCVGVDRYDNPARLKDADNVISDMSNIDISFLEALVS
jgi:beta-phosphoglucomutase